MSGAPQMELPCPLISGVNPFPRRFINRTTFFCNAWIAWMRLLPAVGSKKILLSFLHFHWLFSLLARETYSGNCSIYKSTRERVDSNGLYGRWRLHLMGSCFCGGRKTFIWRRVGERAQVTLVGASAIPPFRLALCDYNLENLTKSCVNMNGYYVIFIFNFFVLSFYFFFFLAPASKLFYVTWVNKLHWHYIFYMVSVSTCRSPSNLSENCLFHFMTK